ncbi:hypothetical protein OE88DRAFT_1641961 [Heliocybe sulcata]|uniref:Protein BIG1 n=1 Tax=Heliocybe sulcata TaxID=5364 RepID=A0A5C3NEX5_9AGAM|nr:hypothetical protein OE88DRAFT_1641961 [Heliocybe sulcata]
MSTRCLVLASLLASGYAYSNTSPLVAWTFSSLSPLPVAGSISSSFIEPILENISNSENICENDAIVVVEQPGLHASDLRTLSSSSPLSLFLSSAASTLQLPYLRYSPTSSESTPLEDLVSILARRCALPVITLVDHEVDKFAQLVRGRSRYIAHVQPYALGEEKWKRSLDINRRADAIYDVLHSLSAPKSHLVLLTGRQDPSSSDLPLIPTTDSPSLLAPNSTLPAGGILKRYQVLTPALITTLLVALGVLVPVIFFGISALARIQAPARMEPPKKFNAMEKKTQ